MSRSFQLLALGALFFTQSYAQTWSVCNPLLRTDCPANPALSKSISHDFSSGASDQFTSFGSPSYNSDGVSFTVAKSGDSPQLTSNWYIMFGKVEVTMKAAPGAGIVSSVVLQSDTLDEIDWEWLGADPEQVQTNFFGKGQTTTYNRGAFHPDAGSQTTFKTYSIEWTANQIVWQIDGVTVRALQPANADNQYPQTPMQLKLGAWSGGDPANAPGTIEWARGPTDYSKGPFSMVVKSIKVSDYSTGKEYKYGDQSGTWQSIVAVGGSVNSGGSSQIVQSPPAVTSSSSGQPIPFQGTHRESASLVRTGYPWVSEPTTLSTATATVTTYPGLPSGWTVSSSGKVIPPSSAPETSQPIESTPSPSPSDVSPSAGGSESNDEGSSGDKSTASFVTLTRTTVINGPITPAPTAPSSSAAVLGAPAPTAAGSGSVRSISAVNWISSAIVASISFLLIF